MRAYAEITIGILELSRMNEHEALDMLRSVIYKPDSAIALLQPQPVVGRPNDFSSSPHSNGEYTPYSPHSYSNNSAPQGCLFVLLNKNRG